MPDDLTAMKDKVERYRRLMAATADAGASAVLSKLITEMNSKIAAAEGQITATQSQQEQPKPEPD